MAVRQGLPLAEGLLKAALAFMGHLRQVGLAVDLSRAIQFVRALGEVDASREEEFYWAARLTLCSRPQDLAPFDEAFAAYWRYAESVPEPQLPDASEEVPATGPNAEPSLAAIDPAMQLVAVEELSVGEEEGEDSVPLAGVFRYSPQEVLMRKDFSTYTAEEFEAAQQLMATIRLSAPLRRGRRLTRARRGLLAFGATLRRSFRTGGEPVRWVFQAAKPKPRRIVFLCDVSGSMSAYSRALLLFLHAAVRARRGIEAFCFGTRLTRVSKELSFGGAEEALARAAAAVVDWSGGTRLGECLKDFCDRWGQWGIARGAVVIVMSDGWDRGDPLLLGEQLARLRRLSQRLIWVNPNKGAPGYEPLTLGMSTALPYVDDFLPGHNLASLESLAAVVREAFDRRSPTQAAAA